MTSPPTPRTAAGRALLADLFEPGKVDDLNLSGDDPQPWVTVILAIEAEAASPSAGLRDDGYDVDWHYCDFDSPHHKAALAAAPAGGVPCWDLGCSYVNGHAGPHSFALAPAQACGVERNRRVRALVRL